MTGTVPVSLHDWLQLEPYQAYSYSYPHKSAYDHLSPPVPLEQAWRDEPRDALFLYVHVPFCNYRCGFCNLFTLARPGSARVEAYLTQVETQLRVVLRSIGEPRFARLAIGGGTPSFLSAPQLERLFTMIERHAGIGAGSIPAGIEISPETADAARLAVIRQAGIDRVSMGVQSFDEGEVRHLVRPQQRAEVVAAIETIRRFGFPTLNLDLIYGIPGQTEASFLASLESALQFQPEELYLYPLYVREQTGLGRLHTRGGASIPIVAESQSRVPRAVLYAAARERLLAAGYEQVSMRLFRAPHAPNADAPDYSCQNDGMVGIGCGARSYTRGLHYSSEFAVPQRDVAAILDAWLGMREEDFAFAFHGYRLSTDEQVRRFVIQSLLTRPGLDLAACASRFGGDARTHLPQLGDLLELGLAEESAGILALNAAGIARSDTLGLWLTSPAVAAAMCRADGN